MLTSDDLLNALRVWTTANEEALAVRGVKLELAESPRDLDPRSIRLFLESEGSMAELIVWGSGVGELQFADPSSGVTTPERREIQTQSDLDAALADLTSRMER